MTKSSNPARKHHYVPQLLLRRFARDGKILTRIERTGTTGPATPKSVCYKLDFYTAEGGLVDPLWIENHSSAAIEGPAAAALEAVTNPGAFPLDRTCREAIARFVAWQFVRGPDAQDFINTSPRAIVQLFRRTIGRIIPHRQLEKMLGEIGFPVDFATGELRKSPLLQVQTTTADRLVETVLSMRIALVRFPDLALITSDRPVVQWGKIDADTTPFGVGIDVAHSLSFHLDPRHALLFVSVAVCGEGWDERVVEGAPEHADVLNRRAAYWAWERVFHHPDHTPMHGKALPVRSSFEDELNAEIDRGLLTKSWPIRTVGRWLFQ